MGLGPPVLELYRQLKLQGALEGASRVMELGSQDFWCPQKNLVASLFKAFGREVVPALLETTNEKQAPARLLYEALGLEYCCVDIDGRHGSLAQDLNFDAVPEAHRARYDLVTNHGTSEHILNQYNVFKAMHDFAAPGALLVNAVPFTVHLEHGFFNYQPNFFEALARYNAYETLGIWIGPDWRLASFIPWDPTLLDYLTLNSKTTHLLVVVQRKKYASEFCVPIQDVYEPMVDEEARDRYAMVVDGEVLDGKRARYLTRDALLANEYQARLAELNGQLATYADQVEALRRELAVARRQIEQMQGSPARGGGEAPDFLGRRYPQSAPDATSELLRNIGFPGRKRDR